MPEALLIFDCDGMLVDSERLSHGVLQQMLSELGVALPFDATVERFIGTSLPVCLARVGELLGGTLPEGFWSRFTQRTRVAFEAGLQPMAGVERLLAALRTPYCVASNGNRAKVEDTPTGIVAAKAAGMRAIGFAAMTPRAQLAAAGADALVDSMDELAALL
jgi:beta-phosphoglucomutase-like phosphatase (HAD superfamily)